jgi:damage-control phosphatase, subfamily III
MLSNLPLEDLERMQGRKAISEQRKNIVVDDIDRVWEYVDTLKNSQIDIILDNAGSPSYEVS